MATITTHWQREQFSLNNAPVRRPGVYIIYLRRTSPIYVGAAHSLREGVRGRLMARYRILTQHAVNTENYTAKICTVDPLGIRMRRGNSIYYQYVELVERIITRTLSEGTRPLRITNVINTRHSISVPQDTKLELTGHPPRMLIERLNRDPRTDRTNTNPPTYEIRQGQYESFADGLTLRELRELEWV